MKTMKKQLLASALGAVGLILGTSEFNAANALSLGVPITLRDGNDVGVSLTLDDMSNPGSIRATLQIDPANPTGDLSGLWFDVTDSSLLGNFSFTEILSMGAVGRTANFITGVDQDGIAGNLGKGVNLNGSGQSEFDVGFRIGESGGINGGDDFQKIVFDIANTEGISLSDFGNWGVRVKSVAVGGGRGGSSKLAGETPDPTAVPTPAAVLPGVLGMATAAFRKKKQEDSELQKA